MMAFILFVHSCLFGCMISVKIMMSLLFYKKWFVLTYYFLNGFFITLIVPPYFTNLWAFRMKDDVLEIRLRLIYVTNLSTLLMATIYFGRERFWPFLYILCCFLLTKYQAFYLQIYTNLVKVWVFVLSICIFLQY